MIKVGLVGGLSPESTVHYYQYLYRKYNERFGKLNFPVLTLDTVNLQELVEKFNANLWHEVAEKLLQSLHNLKSAGCDFAAILANTPHNAYDLIRNKAPLPILTIMEATCQALQKEKIKKVILLGTRATMEYGFFQRSFQAVGIETVVPEQPERAHLDALIWDELSHGIVRESSRQSVKTVIEGLAEYGSTGIVLGCTELAMIVSSQDSTLPIFDTTEIHAQAILQKIIQNETTKRAADK